MKTVGALLQGGRSSRMGQEKANVVIGGQTMRARVRAALAGVVDEVVQLGGRENGSEPVIADPGEGPLGAVVALLHSGRGDRYVVAAVDQPFLSSTVLTRLLSVELADDGAVSFAGEPLPCVVQAGARTRALLLASSGERRLWTLMTTTLPPSAPERRALRNLNTPHDVAMARLEEGR
jgi:molybdopterin-guanine dinucleotide biosynthesis protein A